MKDSPRDYASGRRRPGFLRLGFRMRSRMVLRHLRDGARVLDVGAADGAMVEELSHHLRFPLAVSVERDPELAACIPRGGVCANGLALPFPDATFDFAVCCATRKHVRDSGALMREIARVLRPGGTVVVVDPHPWVLRLGRRLGKFDPRYLHHFSLAGEMARELEQAGFTPEWRHNGFFVGCAGRKA